ncbi:secretion protein, partial [Candidatus Pelagibacter bacterium]|nr:secretion protein [Candidatus Pelagibacter bacterium]
MKFIKNFILILLFIFPITNSFGEATLTHVQTIIFADQSSAEKAVTQSQIRGVAGIEFNKDGTKLFMSSFQPQQPATDTVLVSEFNLSTPYDISSRTYAGDSERCAMSEVPIDGVRSVYDLELSHDGTKLFVASRTPGSGADSDNLFRYDLTTPYDISTCQFAQETDLDTIANLSGSAAGDFSGVDESYIGHRHIRLQGFEFNNTGTKLFLSWFQFGGSDKLLEYTLSTPYDITSIQLVTTAGIEMGTGTTADVLNSTGIRFSANGKRIFIISHDNNYQGISQISLTNAFDTSSFVMDGKFNLKTASPTNVQPRGVAFSSSGLKLYIGNDYGQEGFDQIMEYDLVCPFTIFSGNCPPITENNERTGLAIAQIEVATRTIEHSTDTALNRLKWIRRNKDNQNLTNLNLDLNFTNPMLASLTKVVKTS